jgi:hypothetical protein
LSLAQTYSLFLAAPLLMTALSVPILGETVTARRWLAIAAGLGGVLVILQPWGIMVRTAAFSMAAAGAAALATLCYSVSALTVRALGRTNSSMSMVFWYLLLVAIGCGALALGDWRPIRASDWGWLDRHRPHRGSRSTLADECLSPRTAFGGRTVRVHGVALGLRHRLDILVGYAVAQFDRRRLRRHRQRHCRHPRRTSFEPPRSESRESPAVSGRDSQSSCDRCLLMGVAAACGALAR